MQSLFRNLLVICRTSTSLILISRGWHRKCNRFWRKIASLYKQEWYYFSVYNKESQFAQLFRENISSDIVKPCCILRNDVVLACKEMFNNGICFTLHVLLSHRTTNLKGRTIEQLSHSVVRFELSSFWFWLYQHIGNETTFLFISEKN